MTEKQINKCYWNLNSNFNEFSKIELIMQDTVEKKKKKKELLLCIFLADDFASTSKQKNQYSRVFLKKWGAAGGGQ